MIDLKIRDVQRFFFSEPIVHELDKATRDNLSKSGAFIMRAARSLIKKARQMKDGEMDDAQREIFERRLLGWKIGGKQGPRPKRPLKSSEPGEPPRSITGLLRKFIYFAYDPSTRSVVIGPAKLDKSSGAPATLEYGGTATITKFRTVTGADGQTYIAKRKERIVIQPRPYMLPAYESAKKDLATKWRDSVRRAA